MTEAVRLTSYSHGAGCACKLGPEDLTSVLDQLAPSYPADVLVSPETRDDAAVTRLPDGRGLVQTVDFFTPIVDDAFDWGRIAAANAVSDVYAMGGLPAYALNLVGWPAGELPFALLGRVLEGAAKVAAEAGTVVVGGHSIDDREPKFGMAVTGFVELDHLTRNSTAPVGATLFLTKPLGTGILTTALKRGEIDATALSPAVESMTTLNAPAAAAMVESGAEAATDVTGFGLLGHLHEMLAASGVSAEIDASRVPLLPGVLELAESGVAPGGTHRNLRWVDPRVEWGGLPEPQRIVLADAQTSGGLLIAVSGEREDALRERLDDRGVLAAEVGRTIEGPAGHMRVVGRLGA